MGDIFDALMGFLSDRATEGRELVQEDLRSIPGAPEGLPGQNLIRNLLMGADPTGGLAVDAIGTRPKEESFPLQMIAGVLSPSGMSKSVASGVRGAIKHALDARDFEDLISRLTGPGGHRAYTEAVDKATSRELVELDDAVINAYIDAEPGASRTAVRLVGNRPRAERAARALTDEGDEVAREFFTETVRPSEFDADLPAGVVSFFAEDFTNEVFDAPFAAEALNQNMADEQLWKLLLGID